jgi:hypothetical protein
LWGAKWNPSCFHLPSMNHCININPKVSKRGHQVSVPLSSWASLCPMNIQCTLAKLCVVNDFKSFRLTDKATNFIN